MLTVKLWPGKALAGADKSVICIVTGSAAMVDGISKMNDRASIEANLGIFIFFSHQFIPGNSCHCPLVAANLCGFGSYQKSLYIFSVVNMSCRNL